LGNLRYGKISPDSSGLGLDDEIPIESIPIPPIGNLVYLVQNNTHHRDFSIPKLAGFCTLIDENIVRDYCCLPCNFTSPLLVGISRKDVLQYYSTRAVVMRFYVPAFTK
jgi:hypothetical protein